MQDPLTALYATMLNQIGWDLAVALGRVSEGETEIEANLGEVVEAFLAEFERLKQRDLWLTALEDAGVDNWEGYDHATETHTEWVRENV